MPNHLTDLIENIEYASLNEGMNNTVIPGVRCTKVSSGDNKKARTRWRASFSLIAQGQKEIRLGTKTHRFPAGDYIVAPIDLVVNSRIADSSARKPFLGILVDFDSRLISELTAQSANELVDNGVVNHHQAVFGGHANEEILESTMRLARLLKRPGDAKTLGPLLTKEIFYHVLKDAHGPAIQQFLRSGHKMHKMSEAAFTIQSSLQDEIDVNMLAETANMSRSAFFAQFKATTSLSPIQYQKKLRLLEAKRLMLEHEQTAESAAYQVGYSSSSQFSREFSRLFGLPPKQHALKSKGRQDRKR